MRYCCGYKLDEIRQVFSTCKCTKNLVLVQLLHLYSEQLYTPVCTDYRQTVYMYMVHSKINETRKFFRISDNQFLIKFWLLMFSIIEILNPKVGTVQRKYEMFLWPKNRLSHVFSY